MPKQKASYEALLAEVVETLKHSSDGVHEIVQSSAKYVNAANDLTKDELALISAYIEADLKEFSERVEQSKSGPFYLMITNSIWQGLLDITDRTTVEWRELFADLEHQGLYQVGDMIGLGILVCDHCGHKTEFTHPTVVEPCTQCGGKAFSRQALKP
ncbi:MAG: zinc ribbon-containing protein [Vibrio sp.]